MGSSFRVIRYGMFGGKVKSTKPDIRDGDDDGLIYDGTADERAAPIKVAKEVATMMVGKQTDTEEFKQWFRDSKVVDESGSPLVVYHGSARPDRIGNEFQEERATSGPMAFFTDDPDIASSYAANKRDTSIEEISSDDPATFTVNGHPLSGEQGNYNSFSHDAWKSLSWKERNHLRKTLRNAGYRDWDDDNEVDFSGEFAPNPNHFDFISKREHQGDAITALYDMWVYGSGDVDGFKDIMRASGVPFEHNDPTEKRSAVFPVFLSVQKPLDTGDIPDSLVSLLESSAKEADKPSSDFGSDLWDKNTRDPVEWVESLKSDMSEGKNSFVWTSIPDFVTKTLASEGYDGIVDTGGKMGGEGHDVWIPFTSEQVKSAIGNNGSFDPANPDITKGYQGGKKKSQFPDIRDGDSDGFIYDGTEHERAASARVGSGRDWKASLGYGGMREGFLIEDGSGARATGYAFNADFGRERSSATRGELFFIEVPEDQRGKGVATELATEAVRFMQDQGAETVAMHPMQPGAKELNARLVREGVLRGPINQTESGKVEYEIASGKKDLTPVKQTDTPEFKSWFGGSVVRKYGGRGEPMVVYHGTVEDFTEFMPAEDEYDYPNRDRDNDIGFFFASFAGESEEFARPMADLMGNRSDEFSEYANIMPVYLRIENPVVFETQKEFFESIDEWGDSRWWKKDHESMGHDGVQIKDSLMGGRSAYNGEWFVAFSSGQIKSATGNDGNFDPNNPDITKSVKRGMFGGVVKPKPSFRVLD